MDAELRVIDADIAADDEDAAQADAVEEQRQATPRPYHTKHDVDRLQQECQKLSNAIASYGVPINMPQIEVAAMAFAALRLLVLSGLISESDAQGEQIARMRDILGNVLVQVEAQADARKQQHGKVQPVRAPGLVVARH